MLYLTICSFIWAFSYGLTKGHLVGISPDLVCLFRMVVPFFCFLPFLTLKKLSFKEIGVFFSIGAVQYGLMYLCVLRAYPHLSAYQVVFFTACTPIYVTLIDDLFSKKLKLFYLLMAVFSFLGVAFLYYEPFVWKEVLEGFYWVQLSDLCFALGQVSYRRFKRNKKYSDESIYALLFLGGAFIASFSTTLLGGWEQVLVLSMKQILVLLYLGSVASGLCFFWWNRSSVRVVSGTLAVFNNVKIPLGVLVSILVFHEKVSFFLLMISFFLLILGLLFSESYSRKKSVVQ